MVDALSTEATLVSRSLWEEVSDVWERRDVFLRPFGSSGDLMGSTFVLMGSGWGGCLSLWRDLSLEKIDLFSAWAGGSLRTEGPGLEFRGRAEVELVGVLFWGVPRNWPRLLVEDSRLVDGRLGTAPEEG